MRQFLNRFRRLQWKLTLSYTAVTTGVVLLIIMGVLLLALTLATVGTYTSVIHSLLGGMTTDLAPFFAGEEVDRPALQTWLDGRYEDGVLLVTEMGGFEGRVENVAYVTVVDPAGRVQAVAPNGALPAVAFDDLPPGADVILQAALDGDVGLEATTFTDDERGLGYVAYPIFRADEGVVGALLVQLDVPAGQSEITGAILSAAAGAALPVALVAALGGALFGWIATRGLTRRLRRLSAATAAWSSGDFSVAVEDRSGDEIGTLTRRMNEMAVRLQELLAARQELATLEERNRLARELHDSVKQQLFATAMQAAAARELLDADPEQARRHLEQTEQLARQSQLELSQLIQELRPAALEGRGLVPALREYAEQWSRYNEIEVDLIAHGERSVPLEAEQALFRVAQEALSNVARHSGARRVAIRLEWDAAGVSLDVEDNGSGFQPGRNGGGFGLHSMRQRLAALDGEVRVESVPGSGTRVRARCPTE